MREVRQAGRIFQESAATARSQPVMSAITAFMVASVLLAVMLTTGRTVAAEQQVLATIDSAGSRTVVVRIKDDEALTSDVVTRLETLRGIEWFAAFSRAYDTTNSVNPDGIKAPIRYAYGPHLQSLGIPRRVPEPGDFAYASEMALNRLGLVDGVGGVRQLSGTGFAVAGQIEVPEFLTEYEPLVLVPQVVGQSSEPITLIIVVAQSAELVSSVVKAVTGVLGVSDPNGVTVSTSATLAELSTLIGNQLGSFARAMVLALLMVTGALMAIILYGLVMMRRKDFGRRRALGASRSLIIWLLLTQTGILAVLGVALGTSTAALILFFGGDPQPGLGFTGALAILTVFTALLAALVPAIVASRREPIKELRVP